MVLNSLHILMAGLLFSIYSVTNLLTFSKYDKLNTVMKNIGFQTFMSNFSTQRLFLQMPFSG